MNNITLAHMGAEVVLIGGISFYFHRKTKKLTQDLEAVKKENATLKEAIEELNDKIEQLAGMMMQMRTHRPQPPPQQSTPQMSSYTPISTPGQSKKPQPAKKSSKPVVRNVPIKGDDSGDETLDDSELDRELATEFQQLDKERTTTSSSTGKLECDDDVCKLID